ncbi:MAG: hypothetical protein JSW50_09080 [Candidatus Latescibacterota bacterium]|nr:MAG: hypothetical protein JSW50_09080 [Candidatus Latescibacterota bacterium]
MAVSIWDGISNIDVAVMVDVDGTLCSPPVCGKRVLRPDAEEALRELSRVAHVVLWSMSGRHVGELVLEQFPQLAPYVSYVAGKADLPCHLIGLAYCIDDGAVGGCVKRGNQVIVERFNGGDKSGALLEAAKIIADDIRRYAES